MPKSQQMLTLNPLCFMLNSIAMGDVICSVPVIKHMVEKYYTDPRTYMVIAKEMFRPFFHFIPEGNFHAFEDKDNNWGISESYAMAILNTPKVKLVTRNTPRHMSLGQFAAIKLANRVFPDELLKYVPLEDINVAHFGVEFSKAVILVTSYRDLTRAWDPESMLAVARFVEKKGYIPVFIGKTDMNLDTHIAPKSSLSETIPIGVDLRNKTTIPELASIMKQSRAVCGIDSGPIHLAGTTAVPIICGYTSIAPEFRIPIRDTGDTYPIVPNIPCIGCESRWNSQFWNFEDCYLGHIDCCKSMTPAKFIKALEVILK